MTIERRIQVASGIIILIILIIGSILLWNAHEVENGIDQLRVSSQVVRSAFLLKALMDEYLTHGDSRPLRQWNKRDEFLGKIINDAKGFESIDQVLVKDLEIKYQAVNSLHPQIIQLVSSGEQRQNLKVLKETLAGMMSVRLEELVNAAEHLHTASQSSTLRRQKLAQTLILATSILLIGLIVINLYQIRKNVVYPLQELSRGAEIIGEGNFEYAVDTRGEDEVGKLAQAFNTMVGRLKTIHDSLQAEIEERKRSESIILARLRLVKYASSHSLDELLQATLDEVEALTGSSIGFYHFLEADQRTLWLQAWSTRTLAEMCTAEGKGLHYDLDKAGVWADCISERRAVIHNDYSALPHRKGMPDGHADVIRELVVPVFRGDRLVAVLGVGNKPVDYGRE